MKLVIDISEKIYDTIMADEMPTAEQMSVIVTRIYQGTPLVGHGRLVDADAYRKDMLNSREFDFFKKLDMQPTIIEADKER